MILTIGGYVAWTGAFVILVAAVSISVFAIRLRQPALALFALLPVSLGMLAAVFDIRPDAPLAVPQLVALALATLGIVAGHPLTVWVLDRASRDVDGGEHGGILVPAPPATPRDAAGTREVLRGGTWIGYLERLAVVGAIVLGRFEIVAGVIAIKGLGRFTELDSPVARERFLIGTLVSMSWAAVCAVLIARLG